ncbi:MAG: molybdopterin converting factor subunit 1 [Longimicrobiales bacterium]
MRHIRVRLLFFAQYRDLAGSPRREIDVPVGCTAAELVRLVRAGDARLAALPSDPIVAINESYAELDAALNDGDEVALLPPVCGG